MSASPVLETKKLTIGYGTKTVCTGIDFVLRRGEILCVIGPNGGGKSTLLSTLSRYLPRISGSILLHGVPIETIPAKELAKELAILTTEHPYTGLSTCREIVESGRYPYTGMFGRLSDSDHAAVALAMREAAVTEFADQFFSELSDGQKQRVLLAKAFAQETGLLILDEPTSFLDIRYRLEFLELLSEKVRQDKLSVIMSMHEIDTAAKIADTVVCLGDGKMRSCGGADILTDTLIRDLFHISTVAAPLLAFSISSGEKWS